DALPICPRRCARLRAGPASVRARGRLRRRDSRPAFPRSAGAPPRPLRALAGLPRAAGRRTARAGPRTGARRWPLPCARRRAGRRAGSRPSARSSFYSALVYRLTARQTRRTKLRNAAMASIFLGLGANGERQGLELSRANRHGLIAGATGTGKTVTLQGLAEDFSAAGVPVFLADVKGDLAGIAMPGSPT